MKEIIIEPRLEKDYQMPTKVIFGRNSLRRISEIPIVKEAEKILLVTGKHFNTSQDYVGLVSEFSKKELFDYPELITKSDFLTIDTLVAYVKKCKADVIVAVGGGSILDTAKCAAILTRNDGLVAEYVCSGKTLLNNGIPFIAIPTTAGTGSEVTPWATVWDENDKKKYSLSSPLMFPSMALVDSSLSDSLPSKITAETGIDALAQAIEAYWSIKHNPVSDQFALESIRLIMSYLGTAVNSPDENNRDMMSKASLLAGLAFSNTQTTICHSVSYPITARFGVPHGQAVAITLPSFLEYSFPVLPKERGEKLLEVLGVKNISEAKNNLISLMEKVFLATKLSQLGIAKEDIDILVLEGFHPGRAGNAPRVPTKDELKQILEDIL